MGRGPRINPLFSLHATPAHQKSIPGRHATPRPRPLKACLERSENLATPPVTQLQSQACLGAMRPRDPGTPCLDPRDPATPSTSHNWRHLTTPRPQAFLEPATARDPATPSTTGPRPRDPKYALDHSATRDPKRQKKGTQRPRDPKRKNFSGRRRPTRAFV